MIFTINFHEVSFHCILYDLLVKNVNVIFNLLYTLKYIFWRIKMSYFQKANELYNSHSYKQAINLYKKAIENKENEACAHYNSAVCLIKLKEYEKAILHLKSALVLKQDSKYYFNLAYCYSMIGNSSKSLLYFNTSWAMNHEDEDCNKAINLILKNNIK